jgi:hypothetical protein
MLRLFKVVAAVTSLPVLLGEYFASQTGKQYGIGFFAKIHLLFRMARNQRRIPTASHFLEHIIMAVEIMKVQASLPGSVVECGSFKGGSTANLSLICALCHRKLEVFDSFTGLPEPSASDRAHLVVGSSEVHTYQKGAYCGNLTEVKANVERFGEIKVCGFTPGYFEQTLPDFTNPCVFIFLDVDLVESLKTCCRYLWPRLQNNCRLFTHEAQHLDIAKLFFDREWWLSTTSEDAPGLIGAGTGLGLLPFAGGFHSSLGYAVKNPEMGAYKISPQVCSS